MRIGDWMSDVCSSDLPPAAAQFSDSYSFLQAVEKRDGDKATSLLTDNDTRVINTRNPDTGETALAIVVKRRDLTWLRFLLGKDADPSIADRQGMTPLMHAALIGFSDGADVLLDHGAPKIGRASCRDRVCQYV